MSSLDRLLIKGIRSFAPDNSNVIVFKKPLNLIIGTNGAGKTTIIECLKYATTGLAPPPSEKGLKHFLHDPKVFRAICPHRYARAVSLMALSPGRR